MTTTPITDWRGTPIEPGQPVIYGSGVGRSIQLVEGVVDDVPFTDSKPAQVRVRVIRRSYTTGSRAVVPIGPDRLTVVTGLPESTVPTQLEKGAAQRQRYENRDTHDMPPYYLNDPPWGVNPDRNCRACGADPYDVYETACPDA